MTDFACYRGIVREGELPVARGVASRIITLPIYSELGVDDVTRICDILRHIQARQGALPAGSRVGVPNIAADPQ